MTHDTQFIHLQQTSHYLVYLHIYGLTIAQETVGRQPTAILLETVLLTLAGDVGHAVQGSAATTATASSESLPALDEILVAGSV